MILVDKARVWPATGLVYCHLWDRECNRRRLHKFARRIGLRRSWFQNRRGFPHYDLIGSKIELALKAGAVPWSLPNWRQERRDAGFP